jgi:hypothetical protein
MTEPGGPHGPGVGTLGEALAELIDGATKI